MAKLVYGAGFNDKTKPVKVCGKDVKEYTLWQSMLRRCFNDKCQAARPTYRGCTVSDSFLNYSYFYAWCQAQIGFGNTDDSGRYWHLDKDLLIAGNKTYSEHHCVFVPSEINIFFTDKGSARGNYPIGVDFHKPSGKFRASCSVNGKQQSLGYFNTAEEAFLKYKPFKESLCKQLALKWKSEIDPRLFQALVKWEVNCG